MIIGLTDIQKMGHRLAETISGRSLSPINFADEAESALRRLPMVLGASTVGIAEFLCDKSAPIQSDVSFSDMPVIVFRHQSFYIELLHWRNATTSIHAHAFAGAFMVLQGSSLHTPWKIKRTSTASPNLALVDAELILAEHLRAGDIRKIIPGETGLVHSLYHLESPSISLVVRTEGCKDQFSLFRPGLWLNHLRFLMSRRMQSFQRLIRYAEYTEPGSARLVLRSLGKHLNLDQWIYLLLSNHNLLDSEMVVEDILDHRSDVPDNLGNAIRLAIVHAQTVDLVTRARDSISDPDLRFFLALLLNVSEKPLVLDQIAARFPEKDPALTCANLLLILARYRGDPRHRLARIAAASSDDYRIGVEVRSAIGLEFPDDNAVFLLQNIISTDGECGCDSPGGTIDRSQCETIRDRIGRIPLFKVLVA